MIIIRVGLASDKAFAASTQHQSTHIPAPGPSQGSGANRPFPLQRVYRPDEYAAKPIIVEMTQRREPDANKLSLRDPAEVSDLEYAQEAKPRTDIA